MFVRKWWKCLLVTFVVVLVSAAFGAKVAYDDSPKLLTIDSGRSSAGAIVVLGGDPTGRPTRAAELFAAGEAPLVIISGDGDWNKAELALKTLGVPARSIIVDDRSKTTKENAEFSVALLRQAHLTNAIIVTSWYHSRRALRCFEHYAPDIKFYSRPSYDGLNRAEWSRNGVGVHIRAEYAKLLGYWLCYGVSPFKGRE